MNPSQLRKLVDAARRWVNSTSPRESVDAGNDLRDAVVGLPPGDPLGGFELQSDPPGTRRVVGYALSREDLTILLQLPPGLRVAEVRPPVAWSGPDDVCVLILEGPSLPLVYRRSPVPVETPDVVQVSTRHGDLSGRVWFGMVLVGPPENQSGNQKTKAAD